MFDFLSFLVGLLTAAVVFLGLEVHNLKAKIVVAPVEEAPVEEAPVEEAPVEEAPPAPVVRPRGPRPSSSDTEEEEGEEEEQDTCYICHQEANWYRVLHPPLFGRTFCSECEDRFHVHTDRAAEALHWEEHDDRMRAYYGVSYTDEDDSGSEDRETPPSYSEQE